MSTIRDLREAFMLAFHDEPVRKERMFLAGFATFQCFYMILDLDLIRHMDHTPLWWFEWLKFAALLFFTLRPGSATYRHLGKARWFTESFKPLYWLSFCSVCFDFIVLLWIHHRTGEWG